MKHAITTIMLSASMMLSTLAVSAAEAEAIAAGAAVAVASVVAVDEKTRAITLVGSEGDEWTFTAGPEVRNFAQIKRGDRVIASYYAGFALGLGPKGSGVRERIDAVRVDRAKPGDKPAGMLTRSIEAVGLVKAIDRENRAVTVQGAKQTVALEVSDDVDLSQVKVGDEVEAIYIESYAVNVVPAPEVSGTVTLDSKSVAIGIGVSWGHGTLTMYDGTTYKFKVNGLSVVDLGISRISATGEVYNLVQAKDLNGTFIAGEAGITTLLGGGSVSAMQNSNGVVMQLKSSQKGMRLTLAPEGLNVELVE